MEKIKFNLCKIALAYSKNVYGLFFITKINTKN